MNNQEDVLKKLKEHEDKVKRYQIKDLDKNSSQAPKNHYRFAAYQVRNPFRGI